MGAGQALVHKISYSKFGQWKLASRSVIIKKIELGLIPKQTNMKNKCGFSVLDWLRIAVM